jgi:RES domain-containing protein
MWAYRLSRNCYPAYDGQGSARFGGRWNSKGVRVLYLSENRALAVLEILAHLSTSIPDKYDLGAAEIPSGLRIERVPDDRLPADWATAFGSEQVSTRRIGDEWVEARTSAVLSVPSVIVGERNYVLNLGHPDIAQIRFAQPIQFHFDGRLLQVRAHAAGASPGTTKPF